MRKCSALCVKKSQNVALWVVIRVYIPGQFACDLHGKQNALIKQCDKIGSDFLNTPNLRFLNW